MRSFGRALGQVQGLSRLLRREILHARIGKDGKLLFICNPVAELRRVSCRREVNSSDHSMMLSKLMSTTTYDSGGSLFCLIILSSFSFLIDLCPRLLVERSNKNIISNLLILCSFIVFLLSFTCVIYHLCSYEQPGDYPYKCKKHIFSVLTCISCVNHSDSRYRRSWPFAGVWKTNCLRGTCWRRQFSGISANFGQTVSDFYLFYLYQI